MKNKLVAILILTMLFASIMPLSVGSGNTTGYIRGLWHFDEGMGTNAYDDSGFDNNGVIYGGAMWTDGKLGNALDFDGVDNYVEVPDSNSLDVTGKITLEAWIYPRTMTHLQVIVSKYNHSAPYNGAYYLGLGGYGYMNKILFGLSNDGLHYYYLLSNTNITANTWTHVAGTLNGTHMTLYINGNKDKLRSYAPGVIYASTAPLRIGCYLPELGFPRFFDGIIDEVKVSATTIWTVDDDKIQCPTADFTNIQDAIDAASSGDTVKVYEGTYTEQLVINKSLTLLGDPGPKIVAPDTRNTYTIAESTATWDPIIFAYGGTESGGAVGGSGTISVTIDGFEIDGGNKATTARFVGILYRNVNPGVVSNNDIHDMYDADGEGDGPQTFGIMVCGDSDVTIEFNKIRDFSRGGIGAQGDGGTLPDPTTTVKLNTVLGNGLEAGTGWWAENGIQIAWGAGGSIIENDVSACQVNSPSWVATGIMVYDAVSGVNTLNNSVTDCDTGIAVISPSYDLVDGNVVTGCTWDGIRLGWPVDNCTVSNNIISDSWAGIGVWDASDNTIEDNIIEDNEHGICMDGDSHNNVIIRNDILNNMIDGIHIEPYYVDPSGTKVHYNNIAGNDVCGVNKTGSATVDARFNWWGDSSGPCHDDTNLMGSGDKVTDNVNYSPWLGFGAGTTPMTYHVNPTGKIQDAIDDAASGDTILVHDGTYNEALYLDKTLTIKSASGPVIQGSQSVTTNYGAREAVVFVENAANVILEGLGIQGQGFSGGGLKNYGVIFEEASGTIRECAVSPNTVGDMYSTGIAAWDSSELAIEETTIENFGRIGVFYFNDCTGGVYNSTIIGQVYDDEGKVSYGIEVEGYTAACNIEILRNDIYNCDNTYSPAPLWSSAGIVIDGWMAYYAPPTVYSSTVIIECNEIHDNYYGIEVVANGLSRARYNNIYDNREYGVIQDADSTGNNATFEASLNWWGNDTGPYHNVTNTSGTGDRVSDYVNYDPWLDGPTPGDVAIINITPSRNMTCEGQILDIFVEVKNEGSLTATFTVTLYYGSVAIETKTVTNLSQGANATLTFSWDTTGVTPCTSYTISAEANTLPCEVDTADNIFVDDKVKINIFGDITGDGIVDLDDIILAALAFGGYPGHPKWNPKVDMNNDILVDIDDVVAIAVNFGKTHP